MCINYVRSFNDKIDYQALDDLYSRCIYGTANEQSTLLEEAFCLLTWKVQRHNGDKRTQNQHWLVFGKLLGVGGYVDAALSLIPDGYSKTILDHEGGATSVELTALKGSVEIPDLQHVANHWSLAICAAALALHRGIAKDASLETVEKTPAIPAHHNRYTMWVEGHRLTGTCSKAQILGAVEGPSFKDAVIAYANTDPGFAKYFDADQMTHWGCRLFDNEKDARKSFG